LGNVGLAGESDHDVQLLQLDVDGIVVLDEEDLHLVLEDVRPLLDDEVDVAQRHVLHLHGGENREGSPTAIHRDQLIPRSLTVGLPGTE
jgi:hypothetical protein